MIGVDYGLKVNRNIMEIDFNKIPKIFADSLHSSYGKEHFVIGIRSGENISIFALTRSQMKIFYKELGMTLDKSEHMFGLIDEGSASGVMSPLDLSNPPNGSQPPSKSPSKHK